MIDANAFKKQLHELIRRPSISCASPDWDQGNQDVILYLAEMFGGLGFSCEIQPVDEEKGKYNLIACLGHGPGGLVLSGHSDTVPYDESGWQKDPFTVTDADNRFYGLGTCDMKGFFAVIAATVQSMDLSRIQRPLVVLATADEESSMSGARALADSGRQFGRAAVIGEPTSLRPIRMHKGILMEVIRVTGHSGHSSNPALGVSALECMNEVMGELLHYRSRMQARWQHPGFDVNVPTLNLGHIHGGDNPNRICGHCELHFDLRPLPGMEIEMLRADIASLVQPLAEKYGARIEVDQLFEGVPSFETPASAELVALSEKLTGFQAESVAFATEAPFLQQLGIETIVMGPGSIDQAHQPNEFLAHEQIPQAVKLLQQLIQHYCL